MTSLVQGSVKVVIVMQYLAQHATLCSAAQHMCGLDT